VQAVAQTLEQVETFLNRVSDWRNNYDNKRIKIAIIDSNNEIFERRWRFKILSDFEPKL
jgi:hypothetical protein